MPTSGDKNSGDCVFPLPSPPPPSKISMTKGPNYKGQHGTDLPTPKDKKGEILNLELGKVVRNW